MFSERLKKWLQKTVKDDYKGTIARDIDLFEKSLSIQAPDKTLSGINHILPEALERMSDPAQPECAQESLDSLVKVEPYLRHLLGVLYPERYAMAPKDEPNGDPFDEWTFAPLLKQAFNIIPRNFNLKYGTASINFPYKNEYLLVYAARNSSAHDFADMSLKKIYEIITACLVVYLDIAANLRFAIEAAYSKACVAGGFMAEEYCRGIVHSYKVLAQSGFSYVDIKWQAVGSATAEYSTVETILNDTKNNLIKILGEAGSGKTTIMRQLEYLSAKKFLKKKSTIIPVFIQLGSIETDSTAQADVKTLLSGRLGISLSLLEEMLAMGTLRLYLDGFNEILDTKAKKRFANSVDKLVQQYPELTVFLSDRSLVKSSVDAIRHALIYKLYPLDNELKRKFINDNCPDQKAKALLNARFTENPNYFENFNTPIKLKQLGELVSHQQAIPEDFWGEYVRFLFDREMFEKKDENVEYLEVFASALAITQADKLSEYQAEACIAKCKQILGYTVPDSRKCLRLLVEMGILVLEDGYVEFSNAAYRDYFWMAAFDKHLEDLLEVN